MLSTKTVGGYLLPEDIGEESLRQTPAGWSLDARELRRSTDGVPKASASSKTKAKAKEGRAADSTWMLGVFRNMDSPFSALALAGASV